MGGDGEQTKKGGTLAALLSSHPHLGLVINNRCDSLVRS